MENEWKNNTYERCGNIFVKKETELKGFERRLKKKKQAGFQCQSQNDEAGLSRPEKWSGKN